MFRTIASFLAIASLCGAGAPAQAQQKYPVRPIRVLVGFTPGGQPDIVIRLLAPKLSEVLGQQVVVDNRPGAGGTIAGRILAESNPDGHTLQSISAAHVISPSLYARLPYDTLKDFAGVSLTATSCYLLSVSPASEVRTVQALIALAKAKPGQLNFASAGTGSATHFAGELFKFKAGIAVVHVPYKGIPEALTDTMTGRVQFFMAPIGSSATLAKDGRLRALAVTTRSRARLFPDLPTVAEAGVPGFEWDSWTGLITSSKTPRPIVATLNRAIARVLSLPDVQQRLNAIGMEPMPSTASDFDRMIADQLAMIAAVAQQAGIKAQ